jgi:hypothetical protein
VEKMINSNQEQKRIFKMHKISYIMIAAAIIIAAFIFISPVFSSSASQCNSCHGGYYQYFDILEGNAANQLPATLTVGQTATISVIVENNVNTVLYTALSSVSLTLTSQSGHFTVSAPIFTIGNLPKGTAIVTWQITGVSPGTDSYVIAGSAKNIHQSLSFQDTYSPAPTITVSAPVPTPTPIPTANPTPIPTISPTSIPTATPTQNPTSTNTPTPTTTQGPSPTYTPNAIQTTPPTPTPILGTAIKPTPTLSPITNNTQSNNSNQQPNQNTLRIWFTTPTEGATLSSGAKTIGWTTTGGSGNPTITLELSNSGSSGPWITLAENLKSNNNFTWTIPNQLANYVIRATAADPSNPTQTASITVNTKIYPTIQPETLSIISTTVLLLLFTILIVLVLKRRIIQNETRKQQKLKVLRLLQNSLYPTFFTQNSTIKVFFGELL